MEEMGRKLYQIQEAADKEFEQSPCFRQMKQQNESLKSHIRILESRLTNAAKKSDEQIALIERLQKELQKTAQSKSHKW